MGRSPGKALGKAVPSPIFLRSRCGAVDLVRERGGGERSNCAAAVRLCFPLTRAEQLKEDIRKRAPTSYVGVSSCFAWLCAHAHGLYLREGSGGYGLVHAECPASRMGSYYEKQVTRMTQEGARLCP